MCSYEIVISVVEWADCVKNNTTSQPSTRNQCFCVTYLLCV